MHGEINLSTMNDGVFACYDQMFCSSSLQPSEAGAGQQQEPETSYFSGQNMPNDIPSPPQTQPQLNVNRIIDNSTGFNNARNNIPFVQIHTTDVQPPQQNFGNVFRRSMANSQAIIKSEPIKSESADSGKERANATPTPPVRNTSCNSSEQRIATPAVSQNDDSQERVVAEADSAGVDQIAFDARPFNSLNIIRCGQCRFLCLTKISLEDHVAVSHGKSTFPKRVECSDHRIECPGCPNIFYTSKSFEVHLIEDHFVNLTDVKKIVEVLRNNNNNNTNAKEVSEDDKLPAQQRKSRIYLKNVECLREPRREPMDINGPVSMHMVDSFFSTKNFSAQLERNTDLSDLLNGDFSGLNTNTSSEGQEENSASDDCHNHHHTTCVTMPDKPKKKISIKSVDVLREPALLRRDYELQCNQFVPNEHQYDTFSAYQPVMQATNGISNCVAENLNNTSIAGNNFTTTDTVNNLSMHTASINTVELEKQRRPKIYIKNVDILKEPLMLPNFEGNVPPLTLPNNNANLATYNFLNTEYMNSSSLTTAGVDYDAHSSGHHQITADNYLYESPTLSTSNINNNHGSNVNELNMISGVESFGAYNNGSGNVNVNATFLSFPPMMDCDGLESASTLSSSTTPIMTEPTPPPVSVFSTLDPTVGAADVEKTMLQNPPQQKQKIFIKNVDILKEPQFQVQRERGTLHLRTVDELNLMNRNEVESLIAPNLEHSNAHNIGSTLQDSTMISEAAVEDENKESTTTVDENPDVGFYEGDALKLQDYATQLVSSWSSEDYDLGNDIDCIITESMPESMGMLPLPLPPPSNLISTAKLNHDLETPQMSLISIRDIEELTGRNSLQSASSINSLQNKLLETNNVEMKEPCIVPADKPDKKTNDTNADTATTTHFNIPVESPPPLAPVTTTATENSQSLTTFSRDVHAIGSAPKTTLPPLVPVTPTLSTINSVTASNNAKDKRITSAPERGRIYVANNLVQTPPPTANAASANEKEPQIEETSSATKNRKIPAVSTMGGTSVQGRPFGSNRTFNATKLNKSRNESNEVVVKCSVRNCAFRFKKPETLAYHQRCHDSTKPNSWQAKVCPECNLKDFSNWNTLHTHLWRSHKIDMELYSCTVCHFKTPIYSRLVNTHTKIHSEERNYKCELCGKGFKNTKQLKNHRRWHRVGGNHVAASAAKATTTSSTTTGSTGTTIATPNVTDESSPTLSDSEITLELHRCSDCGSAFSHSKTLREHNCKKSDNQLSCAVCGHVASSKSALKLHMFTHENAKRLKCSHCTYSTSDHNAFRRHKMTHENAVMYECPHCNYKSIQSVTFQKHVLAKHPEDASELIHKCKICTYSTVSRGLFALHQMKH